MDHAPAEGPAPSATARPPALTAAHRFPADPSSVAAARRFVLRQLPPHCRDAADALILMVSELATNAVQHACAPFEVVVTADVASGCVRVDVSDGAAGYPVPAELVEDAPHGRGLHIVEALADAWGIEVRRERPGKTVWCSARVPGLGAAAIDAADAVTLPSDAAGAAWPVPGVRAILDGLGDAIVAADEHGIIRYANSAAEELLGWPRHALIGHPARELVAETSAGPLRRQVPTFEWNVADDLVGRRLPTVVRRADGELVDTELVLSRLEHPLAGRVVVGIFRARDDRRLQRWSELTTELLEILANAPIDDPPAERLLSTLGRRLDWDVTTLWALGPNQGLACRQVWTRHPSVAPAFTREKATDPTSGSGGIPRWVITNNEPLWVRDLGADERFMTEALRSDGLKSAYAFPIRYRGTCVGIVKMLSRNQRERDPAVVELMEAVSGHLGELLHASAQAAEREQLVDELLDARRRNEFLLSAAQVLSEVVEYRDIVQRLAQVSVPVMADLCLIDIVDEDGQMKRMAAWHADPSKRALAEELRSAYAPEPSGSHPTVEVMRHGRSLWSATMDDDFLRATTHDERHYDIVKALGFTSYMTVPLRLPSEKVLGTVTLVSAGSGRRFSERDLGLAEQLARQVSAVVIGARAADRERRISHELQRNMLPEAIPAIEGWSVAARYLPAAVGVEVGGDWYDVVPISDHLVALVVGDVEGHDLDAAKIMSRIRHTLALTVLEEQAPGRALERLNQVALSQGASRLVTALVGVLDTQSGLMRCASAGHHTPVWIADGQAHELPVQPGPPLGVQRCHYKDHDLAVDTGCLLMFTDGLVERHDVPLDDRLALLEASLRAAPSLGSDPVADHVIEAMTADGRSADDIVVLTVCRDRPAASPPG